MVDLSRLSDVAAIQYELDRVRFLSETSYLKVYAARAETWELLCLILSLNGDRRFGINDYIDMIKTARCSRLTMYKFLRDRIDCRDFDVIHGDKRSRKTLLPRKEIIDEFKGYEIRLLGLGQKDLPSRVA